MTFKEIKELKTGDLIKRTKYKTYEPIFILSSSLCRGRTDMVVFKVLSNNEITDFYISNITAFSYKKII